MLMLEEEKTKKSNIFWLIFLLIFCITLIPYIMQITFKSQFLKINRWVIDLSILTAYLDKVIYIVFLFVIFKILDIIFLKYLLKKFFKTLAIDERYSRIIKLLNFIWWTLFVFVAISIMTKNIIAVLASLGLIGFGITFALQKPILNFVGWLTLILKGAYSEGDRIRINKIRGDVKEIQVMNTVLEGLLESSDVPSGKLITFPNELILTTDVENYTKTSNYIVEEVHLSITYESNYHRAVELLRSIILDQIQKNRPNYIKRIKSHERRLNYFISNLLSKKRIGEKEEKNLEEQAVKLEKEKEKIQTDLKEIEDEFKPKIRINLTDSAIELTAQFITPYNQIIKNRTEIYTAFLDAIKKENDIEIAYPHLEIVKK